MSNKNKLLVALFMIGLALFSVVQFIVLPHQNAQDKQYEAAQLEATTHDLNSILPYKNDYMGNNSNIINLFWHLPLIGSEMKFQLFPETFTLEIDYRNTLLSTGKESMSRKPFASSGTIDELNKLYQKEVEKSLIYNSTAAFSLIGNLEHIIYRFSDVSYQVSRANVEALYLDHNNLLNPTIWKEEVQSKLNDDNYVAATAEKILIREDTAKQ